MRLSMVISNWKTTQRFFAELFGEIILESVIINNVSTQFTTGIFKYVSHGSSVYLSAINIAYRHTIW